MQTSRLYYDDCYTSLFKAELVALSGNRAYLNQTFFYPTSGGQPHDTGTLNGIPVLDVVDEGDRIAHLLGEAAEPKLRAGMAVDCCFSWKRRFDHMQQHTGQHLLSAALVELFGFKTLSFHMGEEVSTIELSTPKLDDSQIEIAERRCNDLVAECRPVSISYEDAAEAGGLRKASARSGVLRIITIESYDRSACGGTHVRSTAEIGSVQIRNLDRVRGNIRIEFVCGGRALQHSRQDFRRLTALARLASVPPSGLEAYISGLQSRLEAADKNALELSTKLARFEAEKLYQATPVSSDGVRRASLVAAVLTDAARALAISFSQCSKAIMAVVPEQIPGTFLLACSADSGLHAGNALKAVFASGGGKGGGSATLAQGSVADPAVLERLLLLLNVRGACTEKQLS